MTRLWLVRLGRNGGFEAAAQADGVLTIDFGTEAADLSAASDRQALTEIMARLHPDAKPKAQTNHASQVNAFVNTAAYGDLVVTPMKTSSAVSIERIAGPYRRDAAGRACRPVEWLRQDTPRDAFHQDLLYSLGAIQTVCEVSRNNAIDRVKAVVATERDPGDGTAPDMPEAGTQARAEDDPPSESTAPVQLDRIARDQIERRIATVFTGHDLTKLVAAILRVQGCTTRVPPPGAGKGVDIVAGSGTLGLENSRLAVQVKPGGEVVDQPQLQALIGSVQDTQADHGLIVSWGGFTGPVRSRINDLYFQARLWARDEIVDNLFATYDRLPEDIRADLPLQRTWTLVLDEQDDLD